MATDLNSSQIQDGVPETMTACMSYLNTTSTTMSLGGPSMRTHSDVFTLPCVIVLCVSMLVGTMGNLLIIVSVAVWKDLHCVDSIFIVNLAMSDLYVTLVAVPMSIIAKIEGVQFFDRIPGLCETVARLCTISCVTSLMTIAMMSLNRYFYICRQNLYTQIFTRRNCVLICISLYIVGFVLVMLNSAGIGDHSFDHKSLECIWDRMATFPYTVVFSVMLVWIPCLITGTCYLHIYLYVRHKRRKIEQQTSHSNTGSGNGHRRLHLAKTLFIIYAVFATCWIPYALLIVIDSQDKYPHEVHVYITMFAHLHPSINWLVYYLTNKKFAAAYRHILGCGKCLVVDLVRSATESHRDNTRKQLVLKSSVYTRDHEIEPQTFNVENFSVTEARSTSEIEKNELHVHDYCTTEV